MDAPRYAQIRKRWNDCRSGMRQATRFRLIVGFATVLWACGAPAAGLDDAWDALRFFDFTGAGRQFKALREAAETGSAGWAEATFGLAVSLHQRQPDTRADKDTARALYTELADTVPESPISAGALLMLGRMDDLVDYVDDTPDSASARRHYERIIADFPALPLVHMAALFRAESRIEGMDPDEARAAVAELRAWLDAHPDNPMASHQWMVIAYAAMYPLQDPAAAAQAFIRAEDAGLPPNTQMDVFYWRLANLAEQAGDTERAVTYYRRIIEEVRRTAFAYEAAERIREMGFEPPELIDPFAPEDMP
jgi:tetratricopeptide (TPR) repeat protein